MVIQSKMAVSHCGICFITLAPGTNVIKPITVVIYCHSMVILLLCATKLYYLGNYHGMAINYREMLTLQKVGIKLMRNFTSVLFYNIYPMYRDYKTLFFTCLG